MQMLQATPGGSQALTLDLPPTPMIGGPVMRYQLCSSFQRLAYKFFASVCCIPFPWNHSSVNFAHFCSSSLSISPSPAPLLNWLPLNDILNQTLVKLPGVSENEAQNMQKKKKPTYEFIGGGMCRPGEVSVHR